MIISDHPVARGAPRNSAAVDSDLARSSRSGTRIRRIILIIGDVHGQSERLQIVVKIRRESL